MMQKNFIVNLEGYCNSIGFPNSMLFCLKSIIYIHKSNITKHTFLYLLKALLENSYNKLHN